MTINYDFISVAELDFDTIKSSLQEFLRGQSEYSDFNFDGAGINIILDVLSQNTAMNAFMASMMGNEAFIDSAQIRQSVVSLAKQIGYTPRSKRCAKAVINISVPGVTGSPDYVSMAKGTKFTGSDGTLFSTIQEHKLYPDGSNYVINNVDIYEGNMVSYDYTVDSTNTDQKFLIQSVDADTTTLSVQVQVSPSSSVISVYNLSTNITLLDSLSENYFLQENLDNKFEVYFGDDTLGKALVDNNIVKLQYVVSSNPDNYGNDISVFSPRSQIGEIGTYTVTTVTASYGGAEKQDINSIRYLAPKMYQAQNRAVVKDDYINFLLSEYPWIDSLNVWGGEDNDPPQYGKLFISIKPVGATLVPSSLKTELVENIIRNYNVVTVIPEIVDAEFLYISLDINTKFNSSVTTETESSIIDLIKTNIDEYFDETTLQFNNAFYMSPLTTIIDNTDHSIISTLLDISLQARIFPTIGLSRNYTFTFNNPIVPGTFTSTYLNTASTVLNTISSKQYIVDDGAGLLYTKDSITGATIFSDVGTINYTTGYVSCTLYPYGLPEDTMDIRCSATPVIEDITPDYNQIILLDDTLANSTYKRIAGTSITLTDIYEN